MNDIPELIKGLRASPRSYEQSYEADAANALEFMQARVKELEAQNTKRKALDAQMLMNAAEFGEPNYPVLVRTLQAQVKELEEKLGIYTTEVSAEETESWFPDPGKITIIYDPPE